MNYCSYLGFLLPYVWNLSLLLWDFFVYFEVVVVLL